MTDQVAPPISLEDAKQLVAYIENGENEAACALVEAISLKDSMELFAEVGKLTRQLHDSLKNFQLEKQYIRKKLKQLYLYLKREFFQVLLQPLIIIYIMEVNTLKNLKKK